MQPEPHHPLSLSLFLYQPWQRPDYTMGHLVRAIHGDASFESPWSAESLKGPAVDVDCEKC